MNEQWVDIKGYEGKYQISNYGNVRSINYHRTGKPGNLKQCLRGGYSSVCLSKNDKKKMFLVHRLVLEAFIGKAPKGYECDHKDRNRENNCINNLSWVTSRENKKNVSKWKNSKNRFKGIWWSPSHNRYCGRLKVNGKNVHVGCFKDEIKAVKAYDAIARENGILTNKELGLY